MLSTLSFTRKQCKSKFMLLLRFLFLFCLLFTGSFLKAQDSLSVDTSLVFQTVVVRDSRLSLFDMGRRQQLFHQQSLSRVSTVGQLLEEQSLIHIKNYGPAQLSTAALRGGSASHTAVLWNGLNIDNTMLGLMDLSLLPTALFEEVSIRYGGESAFWGSGAVSGSIHLNNLLEERDPSLRLHQRWNSIGNQETAVSGMLASKKSRHALRLWYQYSPNDFPYTDDFGERKKLEHATFRTRALLQENRFDLGKNEWLDVHLWIQDTYRDIPPTKSEVRSTARQEDIALRVLTQWKKVTTLNSWELRLAFLDETNNYIDPEIELFSENSIRTTIAQAAFTRKIRQNHFLQTHLQARFPSVESNNFSAPYSESQWGANISYKIQDWVKSWDIVAGLRQEWNGGMSSPLLMSIELQGELSGSWSANARFSRNYRFPTFNDRFWSPGGVPDLLPEKGFSQEVGTEWTLDHWQLSINAFSRQIDNWIIWLPRGSFFSPQNIQQVWSRGIESRLDAQLPLANQQLDLSLAYDFVRSTNQKERFSGDASKGKQLIYVPIHKGALSARYSIGPWQFSYRHAITGTVYTLPDHSIGLPPFQIGKLGIQYHLDMAKVEGKVYLHLENIWNEDYELVDSRAMPGKFFQTGIQIQL